ncbi:homeobox protein knotted-1-like 1 [Wolffia australiana]
MDDLFCFHPSFAQSESQPSAQPAIDSSELIKAKISSHPRFSVLVSNYIDCRKVGAPRAVALLLEEIRQGRISEEGCSEVGVDPELDDFMESYCNLLHRFQEELSKPFKEAASFLSSTEMLLSDLCSMSASVSQSTSTSETAISAEVKGSTEEVEQSSPEPDMTKTHEIARQMDNKDLKEMLLSKYSASLGSFNKEFLKKRKNVKLPKDARAVMMAWWKTHYRWPYPTDEEKAKLAEITRLDIKQINNWFVNQRKRHWKPSEDMRSALLDGVTGGHGAILHWDT